MGQVPLAPLHNSSQKKKEVFKTKQKEKRKKMNKQKWRPRKKKKKLNVCTGVYGNGRISVQMERVYIAAWVGGKREAPLYRCVHHLQKDDK